MIQTESRLKATAMFTSACILSIDEMPKARYDPKSSWA